MNLRGYWSILFFSLCIGSCGPVDQSAQNDRWKGKWERVASQDGAQLKITEINKDTLHFILFATGGASLSRLEGTALITDNRATFLADADGITAECEVLFELKNDSSIHISEGGSECGNAMYVLYAGKYGRRK